MAKRETASPVTPMFPMLKTVEQMSKISGIGENKLRELMDNGELEYIQNGNRRLIADAAIWDWYQRAKIAAKPPAAQEGKTMAIRTRQVKNKRDSNGVLTGRPGTVYDVDIKYTAPDGAKKTYTKRGFATKRDASQHEAEMRTKLQNPGQIASIASQRKQTVANYLNEWVESYARVNLRPSTYDGYKKTIANYINPYIGGVALNQLTPAMVDKMFQQIIDKGLKPSTAAGAKRVLSVALSHARKYRYIETNAAKDTLTKFGKGDKTPDPYTPEQVKALMQRVEGTVW